MTRYDPAPPRTRLLLHALLLLFLLPLPCDAQTYTMAPGTVTTCGGNFYDSGGAGGNYSNGENSTMTFCPSVAGQCISVTFTSFDLEMYWDRLQVYDGPNTSAPLIGSYTGALSIGTISASSANASGCLTFRFVCNWGQTNPGWAATVSCGGCGVVNYAMQPGTQSICNGNIYDSGGAAGNYHLGENMSATYCPSTPGQCVQLNFGTVDIEPLWDYLRIYDGSSTAAPLMAAYNDLTPGGTLSASSANSGGCLTLQFTEDGWDLFPGWSAAVNCVPCTAVPEYAIASGTLNTCDAFYYDSGGKLGTYQHGMNVTQTICSGDVSTPYVNVTFNTFNLAQWSDALYVYDGPNTSSPLIGTYAGAQAPFMVSSSHPGGCLTFRFVSDGIHVSNGWEGRIACSGQTALPVFWLSFTGHHLSGSNVLEWQTGAELNNDRFEVERLDSSLQFRSIGQVPGAGNSIMTHSYSFIDHDPPAGTNYYRLRQVDHNGMSSHSNIVAISTGEKETSLLSIFPNPGEGPVTVYCPTCSEGIFQLRLLDACGRLIMERQEITLKNGRLTLDLEAPAKGVYFLELQGDDGSFVAVGKLLRR